MRSSQIHTTPMRQHSLLRLFYFRERFNPETFIGLGFIWSCERCRRIKSSIERGGKRLTRLLKGLESFGAPWREKRERAGRGQKIPLLDCAVLTLFICPSFETSTDFSAVAFLLKKKKTLNSGSLADFVKPAVRHRSVRNQTMRQGLWKEHNELKKRHFFPKIICHEWQLTTV